MFRTVLKVLLVAAVLAGVWAYNRWPVINDVETGQTPEYPDLKVRDYMTSEDKVAKAARATVERLPPGRSWPRAWPAVPRSRPSPGRACGASRTT